MKSRWTIYRRAKRRIAMNPYSVPLHNVSQTNDGIIDQIEDSVSAISSNEFQNYSQISHTHESSSISNNIPTTDDSQPNSKEILRQWAIENKITHNALNGLLKILRDCYDFNLPTDARNLLREFYHFGLEKSLKEFLSDLNNNCSLNFSSEISPTIFFRINCDGQPRRQRKLQT